MTYPLVCVVESAWRSAKAQIAAGKTPPPDFIELIAVLERTLAFAHTGNTKVLSRGLMRPMWIVQSLFEHGLPTLADGVRVRLDEPRCIYVPLNVWPLSKGKPCSAAHAAVKFTYGSSTADVSTPGVS